MDHVIVETRIKRENIAIILVEPQIPENIGAVARAMNNMGIRRLILVRPKNCELARIVKMSTGSSVDIIQEMEVHEKYIEAVGQFSYLVGSTARTGASRPTMTGPRGLARDLVDLSQENFIGIIFGPEDRGLSNEHLRVCHTIATIPTADFSSLNLAQAVMIFCYEILLMSREPVLRSTPRLANRFELEGMYSHLKDVLGRIGFLNPQNPEHWMLNIRRFLNRFPLRAKEVRTIRGICRQMDWYARQMDKKKEVAGENKMKKGLSD